MHDPHTDLDHILVCRKKHEHVMAQCQEKYSKYQRYANGQAQADTDAFPHPVIFFCSKILTDKGSNGNSEST